MNQIHTHNAYILFTALRGPDVTENYTNPNHNHIGRYGANHFAYIKHEITARLRAIVFDEHECQGDYNAYPMQDKDFEAIKRHFKFLMDEPQTYHYVQHLHEAVEQTYGHDVWGNYGSNLVDLLADLLVDLRQIVYKKVEAQS